MIAPLTLTELLAADPLGAVKAAMRARLAALLPGISVVSHPGKIDIADVVAKAVVAAPGLALGWSRVRAARLVDGAYQTAVEWTAYIVVEDMALAARRVDRETLGLAIGARLIRILGDGETATWGMGNLLPPEPVPQPELRPIFTVRDATQGAAYYAVTWTQVLVDQGESLFGADAPQLAADPSALALDMSFEAGIPADILALLGGDHG